MTDNPPKKKRKRDETIEARITYHTPLKTFERIFQETSLEETRGIVRRKLGLKDDAGIQLAQIRGGSLIVLEDDDDFRAFSVTLKTNPLVDVQVTLTSASPNVSGEHEEDSPALKRRKLKRKEQKLEKKIAHALLANTDKPSPSPSLNNPTAGNPSPLLEASLFPPLGPPSTENSNSISSHDTSPSEAHLMSPGLNTHTSIKSPKKASFSTSPTAATVVSVSGHVQERSRKLVEKPGDKSIRDIKEKKSRARKASEPVSVMSPASREKATAILQAARDAQAAKAKEPRKKVKKEILEIKDEKTRPNEDVSSQDQEHAQKAEKIKGKSSDIEKKKRKSVAVVEAPKTVSPAEAAIQPDNTKVKATEKEQSEDDGAIEPAPVPIKLKEKKAVAKKETPKDVNPEIIMPLVFPIVNEPTSEALKNAGPDPSVAHSDIEPAGTNSKVNKKKQNKRCPICSQPWHLRYQCELLINGGQALQARIKALKKTGAHDVLKDIDDYLEDKRKKEAKMSKLPYTTKATPPLYSTEEVFSTGSSISNEEGARNKKHKNKKEPRRGDRETGDGSSLSIPGPVTRDERQGATLVKVRSSGSGSGSVSSDDDEGMPPRTARDDTEEDRLGTSLSLSKVQPVSGSTSASKAIPKTLVPSSSTESESDENHASGNKMDVDVLQSVCRQVSPVRNGRTPSTSTPTPGMRDGKGSPSWIHKQEFDLENGSETDSDSPSFPDLESKPAPNTQAQSSQSQPQGTPRGFLPRLSGLSHMANNLFGRSGTSTGSPLFNPLSTPMATHTSKEYSASKPVDQVRSDKAKLIEESSSESDSDFEDDGQLSRIPKHQRASSRLTTRPRKSVLSQLT